MEETTIALLRDGLYGADCLTTLIWVLKFVLNRMATRLDEIGMSLQEILDALKKFNGKK